jgi:hypothetical protein
MSDRQTHLDLGIEQWEHFALRAVAEVLRSEKGLDGVRFHMLHGCAETEPGDDCNTVACIGGHVALVAGLSKAASGQYVSRVGFEHPLYKLYYPDELYAWQAKPKAAADAIDRFLAGEEAWPRDMDIPTDVADAILRRLHTS